MKIELLNTSELYGFIISNEVVFCILSGLALLVFIFSTASFIYNLIHKNSRKAFMFIIPLLISFISGFIIYNSFVDIDVTGISKFMKVTDEENNVVILEADYNNDNLLIGVKVLEKYKEELPENQSTDVEPTSNIKIEDPFNFHKSIFDFNFNSEGKPVLPDMKGN